MELCNIFYRYNTIDVLSIYSNKSIYVRLCLRVSVCVFSLLYRQIRYQALSTQIILVTAASGCYRGFADNEKNMMRQPHHLLRQFLVLHILCK